MTSPEIADPLPLTSEYREVIDTTAKSAEAFRRYALDFLSKQPNSVIGCALALRGRPEFDQAWLVETLESLRVCAEYFTDMATYVATAADQLESAMAAPPAAFPVIGVSDALH